MSRSPTTEPLIENLRTVEQMIADGRYDDAVTAMSRATDLYRDYSSDLSRTMNKAIAHLSSEGGHYHKPQPQALSLLRLKDSLSGLDTLLKKPA